jgi:hypothetical protein
MKKKIITAIICAVALLTIMFAEYRYIMLNLCPYRGERGTVYIEMFGRMEEYYADPIDAE